jgi:hypothetical protein
MNALDSYKPDEDIISGKYVTDPELRVKLLCGVIQEPAVIRSIAIHLLDQRDVLRRAYASES